MWCCYLSDVLEFALDQHPMKGRLSAGVPNMAASEAWRQYLCAHMQLPSTQHKHKDAAILVSRTQNSSPAPSVVILVIHNILNPSIQSWKLLFRTTVGRVDNPQKVRQHCSWLRGRRQRVLLVFKPRDNTLQKYKTIEGDRLAKVKGNWV